ncbi:MAG: hypothetical protein IM583_03735 [Pseudanabaena sp. M114S2SP2A07QC]|nr:hypothetical protein [Pseudanabaena sp. M090S1SP2A07QC]MCA6505065.1 hypothetical protein [Pseudanabaena sp. M172S2SP2A07QC]MCA6520569.1 hypothetical protein [Pseudanabaena sp. M051S1SP2A07QC]MCA6525189.1 hypothetical protein [Pseudanabaena sp. M179S2SP2A07QC]MCA6535153.1 hypothetical protein [Pseudanabaena sp. M176S2SP2A07QC]MCA6537444.1 hypothetical protein [Pseudanabaena sp. M037S2SP2A07QC]MCA6555753.1 hypothetical protein [Pseudanabaena sp. M114S2SP2A07QC]MCA6559409.1 hypothetical prot
MAERSSAIFWVLNCPIYLLRCYTTFTLLALIRSRIFRICGSQGILSTPNIL